jgi:sugar lactone lactonase YvrE
MLRNDCLKYNIMIRITFILLLISINVSAQNIITITGGGTSGLGDGGLATLASIGYTAGITIDKTGNLYIADQNSHRIRKVDLGTGIITTIAGTGVAGNSGDGFLATLAELNTPSFVCVDVNNNIFISDVLNRIIRKIDIATGIISTFAGNGLMASSGDGGSALLASFITPVGINFDKFGNLYIADMGAHNIRKIDVAGNISTFAGNGTPGFSGDDNLAVTANLNTPRDIGIDTNGNVYIADGNNNRIRKVTISTGIITTVAGNISGGYTGDEISATSSGLSAPWGVDFDSENTMYIADRSNHRIRKVNSLGIISTVAGIGTNGFSGDFGLATTAQLSGPQGVITDQCNNLYIADQNNRRIRKVTFNSPSTPTITLGGITTATVGATVTVNATVSGTGSSYTIRWFRNSSLFSTTTTPTTTFVKGTGIDTITARIVPTIVYCYDSTTAAPHRVLEAPVDIGDLPQRQQYSVYPNPAQLQLTISSPAPIHTITISSPMGQQWLAHTGSGSNEVPLSIAHLPAGLYIVRVNNGYTTKMIKQ